MMGDGKLKCVVDPTPFKGLEQVSDAIDHMYTGKNQGKVGGLPGFALA
jgi:NADPH-dependent curcumin reductase CurA